MHIYIYDSFLSHKKYGGITAGVETRITDLGLNGKIIHSSIMRNIRSSVENEMKRGAKTIVAVGSDKTFNEVMNAIIKCAEKFDIGKIPPLAIIPIGDENNSIAESLGIGSMEEACDILAARRLKTFDICSVNKDFFLSEAVIEGDGTTLEIEKDYIIETKGKGEIKIVNLPLKKSRLPQSIDFNPNDGMFELLIRTKKRKNFLKMAARDTNDSIFSLNKISVLNNKKHLLLLDNSLEAPTPAEINVIKNGLTLIIGKNVFIKR